MFSLFRSKKSPRASPEPIPGPDASTPESDSFVIVGDRNQPQPNSQQQQSGLYPMFDIASNSRSETQTQPAHYLQGVPFKVSPDLSESDGTEAFQVQVDEILAKITRWNSVEDDYDFMLERSLVTQ